MKYIKCNPVLELGKVVSHTPTKATVWINEHTEDKKVFEILKEKGLLSEKDFPHLQIKRRGNKIYIRERMSKGYYVPYFTLIPKTEYGI